MQRPDFSEIKTYEEFSKYYWYREELQKICRALGLKSNGGKIELNKVIESYFNGEKHFPEKQHCSGISLFRTSVQILQPSISRTNSKQPQSSGK